MEPGGNRGAKEQPDLSRMHRGQALQAVLFPQTSQEQSSAAVGPIGRSQDLGLAHNHFPSRNLSCLKSQMKVIQESSFLSVMSSQHFAFCCSNINCYPH